MTPMIALLVLTVPISADQGGWCLESFGWFEVIAVETVLSDGSTVPAAVEAALWPAAFVTEQGHWSIENCNGTFSMPLTDGGTLSIGCPP